MKGNNELRFNPATMIEAVQQYLNSLMVPGKSPKVTGVKWKDDMYCISISDTQQSLLPTPFDTPA
jgi:hypothetical protein